MSLRVEPLEPGRVDDFHRVHCPECGEGWCCCVAWWVPTWQGWSERTAEENRALRQALFEQGHHDGFLLYEHARPVAWCQCGPRDRLGKLVQSYELAPDPGMWAFTCFVVASEARGRGCARALLLGALEHLRSRGVRRVQAFPRRAEGRLDPGEVWTGPEPLYVSAGFWLEREHDRGPIYRIDL